MKNIDKVCTPTTPIKGKLIVDGYSILHEFYANFKLEWASGGCYGDQHRKTLDYFEALVKQGVEPIVVIDGGGTATYVADTIHRRCRDINDLPGDLRKQYENSDCKEYVTHHLPLLSRKVYIASLKQVHNVQVLIADGASHVNIVQLANYYTCPVLTNNSNYCVSGIEAGVVFFRNFNTAECTAPIVKQKELIRFLNFEDPELILAVVAIMGDGCETSIPYLYHGGIMADIERLCSDKTTGRRLLNVVDFLRAHDIRSFHDFKLRIMNFFPNKQRQQLIENCRNAKEIYGTLSDTVSVEVLKENSKLRCSGSDQLPINIVRSYRIGNYPVVVVNAICVGKCTLDADVGDPQLPPVPQLGQPIRQVMYGLATPLMSRTIRRCVVEYYRSDKQGDGKKPWEYAPVDVEPVWKYHELSCDVIFELDESQRTETAKMAMCQTLRAPECYLTLFNGDHDNTFILAILTTRYWAHPINEERFCPTHQLVKALVLNFFIGCESYTKQDQNSMWFKVYHSLLEWQSLYQDVCGLNSMLLYPFSELPPTNTLDSEFVIELALSSPDIVITYQKKLTQERQELYDKIIQAIAN